jgi:hypothetical protein
MALHMQAGMSLEPSVLPPGVVIGAWNASPNYEEIAEMIGAKAFSIPSPLWKALDFIGESWTANRGFIDASIARGQIFFNSGGVGATLAKEMEYLASRGINPINIWL